MIFAGNLEAGGRAAFCRESGGVIKPDPYAVFIEAGLAEERAGALDAFAVGQGARCQCQTCTNALFISRVYIVRVADVNGNGHAGIYEGKRAPLGFSDDGPLFVVARFEVGKLDKEKWEVAFAPVRTPVANERGEKLCI